LNKLIDKGLTTRQRIITAATRMFTDVGYEATSIEGLLDELRISRGALYHHFESKDKVFEAVFETVEADIAKAIMAATQGIADPVQSLQTGCDAFLRLARDNTVRRVVLIDAPAVLGWQKWREIDARHGFGLLTASLRAAAAQGKAREELTEMFAHILLAALMETALVIARAGNAAAATRNGRTAIRELIGRLLVK
jgi:AcrR family transcriptional regulator